MKVTTLVPDDLLKSVRTLSEGKNITDSIIIALREWVSQKELLKLSSRLQKTPLKFRSPNIAEEVRNINRRYR